FDVLHAHHFPREIIFTGVGDNFIVDFQIALILGFILTAPYILWQLWGFIAAGLYRNERKWVRRFVPVSIALFFIGALFFLVVVPVFLDFFISYRTDLPETPTYLKKMVRTQDHAFSTTQPLDHWPPDGPRIPHFVTDPPSAPEGAHWVNDTEGELRMRAAGTT